jgi:hypothetical protein
MGARLEVPLQSAVAERGFAFIPGVEMRASLSRIAPLADWDEFARSWDHLALDTYMADGGRDRQRRHAVYAATADGAATAGGTIVRQPHQPHYQSLDYNPLNGGIARWFEPIDPRIGDGPTLGAILQWSRELFEGIAPARDWRIEVHQFRIEARADQTGRPTPEGVHRDGVDYVLVLLVDRVNIVSGTTTVHALDGRPLGSFTLTAPLDATVLDDARVAHGVTPIAPLDPTRSGHRDALVVTLKAQPSR